jgi:hypothetical protein
MQVLQNQTYFHRESEAAKLFAPLRSTIAFRTDGPFLRNGFYELDAAHQRTVAVKWRGFFSDMRSASHSHLPALASAGSIVVITFTFAGSDAQLRTQRWPGAVQFCVGI